MMGFPCKHPVSLGMGLLCVCLIAAGEETSTPSTSPKDGFTRQSSPGSLKRPLESGRDVGELVPSFYTRAITGPLMNRSVCYVCRNGSRPVVMVFARKLTPELTPLFKRVDRLVDEHRAEGLRSFAVYVSDHSNRAISDVQTFAFDHKISLPLTVSSLAIAEPHAQTLHEDAEVTVVLYCNRRVVSRHGFRAGEIQASQIESVAEAIGELLQPGSAAGDQQAGS